MVAGKSGKVRFIFLLSFLALAVLGLVLFTNPQIVHDGIQVLQKRLWMGGMVSPTLHERDIIFKHAAVATDNKICSKIGRTVLNKKGSAVDAAIASMLCLGVMNPHSTGIGGGGFMMVFIREKRQGTVIDFRESAPRNADKDLFGGDTEKGIKGGLAVAVPGELRGMQLAHEKFGVLPWRELFLPAIHLCREGFEITESLHIAIHKWEKEVRSDPCLRKQFVKNGKLLSKGIKIKNLPLSRTLQRIANAKNADPFYTGKMAKQFVKDVKKHNGIITESDLKSYTAVVRDPLISSLGNFTMLNAPPPASGPVLAFILNILKGYNMTESDFATEEKQALVYHRLIEAFNFAYARRSELADPDVETSTMRVIDELMDDDSAEQIRQKINDKKTFKTSYYGHIFDNKITTGTTHLVVIAPNGDAVSAMSTVNGYLGAKFRSCKMGFIYNNEMDDFSSPKITNEFGLPPSEVNFIKPDKRPLSSSVPVIILDKNSNVRLIAGGSGGSIITTAVAQVIMNNLWFGMNMKDAVQQPRIHSQLIPHNAYAETRMPKSIVKKLKKKGHNITITDDSHAVVQAIARVDQQWQTVCKKGKIENTDYTNFCLKMKSERVGFFAESDYRKGGEPDGF